MCNIKPEDFQPGLNLKKNVMECLILQRYLLFVEDSGISWCKRAGRRRCRGGSTGRLLCLRRVHSQLYLQVINSVIEQTIKSTQCRL